MKSFNWQVFTNTTHTTKPFKMHKSSKIYVAGHRGMVGSAILRRFQKEGYRNIIYRTHSELDLTDQAAVKNFFEKEKPDYVFLAAAKVGGIIANNTYRADFIYENLMIQNNVVHQSYLNNVKKLLFLGSSCIYPKMAEQPIKEGYLLSDYLEKTNEPYAIAKIAGLKLCENYYRQYGCNFVSVMPSNLYGPKDNFDLKKSHVLSALMRKMHLAKCIESNNWEAFFKDISANPIQGIKEGDSKAHILKVLHEKGIQENPDGDVFVEVWGTGKVLREFLYVDDLAEAILFLSKTYDMPMHDDVEDFNNLEYFFNVGTGTDLNINDLATMIKNIVGFQGTLVNDTSKPDGTPRKLLDVSRINKRGWKSSISLWEGIKKMYKWYLNDQNR